MRNGGLTVLKVSQDWNRKQRDVSESLAFAYRGSEGV